MLVNDELKTIKKLLDDNKYTCVIKKNTNLYTSYERGVKPLVQLITSKKNFQNGIAADKVVGKATAYLYVIIGIDKLYAKVISQPALNVLIENKIEVFYEELVSNIINRAGDNLCPFEKILLDVHDKSSAYQIIINKMMEMNIY